MHPRLLKQKEPNNQSGDVTRCTYGGLVAPREKEECSVAMEDALQKRCATVDLTCNRSFGEFPNACAGYYITSLGASEHGRRSVTSGGKTFLLFVFLDHRLVEMCFWD